MGYQCFAGDDNAPVMLVTNLEEGETIAVCPLHLIDYGVGLLESVTNVAWRPEEGMATDPETGDETDEPGADDGQPVPYLPTDPTPTPGPGPDVEADDDGDDGEQLAEDAAVRNAELRAELTGHGTG